MSLPESITNKTLTSITYYGRYIGCDTFRGFRNLTTVNAPMAIFVDDGAFADCSNLSTIDISNVRYFGAASFQNTNLTGVVSLSVARYIGPNAFNGTSITTVTLTMSNCVLSSSNAFPSTLTNIKVHSSYVDFYKTAPGWKDIADKIVSL